VNHKVIIKSNNFVAFLLASLIFLFTIIVLPYYTGGDQILYIKAYEFANDHSTFIHSYLIFKAYTGGAEPISFLLYYLGSSLTIPKIFFDATLNFFLVFYIVKILNIYNISNFSIIILVLTNFYLMVLYLVAERLKISFLFLSIGSYWYLENKRKSVFFYLLSVLSHFQMIILLTSIYTSNLILSLRKFTQTYKFKFKSLFLFSFIIFILFILYFMAHDAILNKVAFYAQHGNKSVLKLLIFYLLSLYYAKKINKSLIKLSIIFLIFSFVILIIGEGRINLFGYMIFLYYSLQYKKGLNFGFLITSFYYLFKTIIFFESVILYGNGFAK